MHSNAIILLDMESYVDRDELLDKVRRVRRQMRMPEMIDICDALEGLLIGAQKAPEGPKVKFDKVAYQREYMRRWRAKKCSHSP